MEFPIVINWTSPFPSKGLLGGIVHFYSNFNRTFFKQTAQTLIRRRILRSLMWVCAVCLCPTKRAQGLNELRPNTKKTILSYKPGSLCAEHLIIVEVQLCSNGNITKANPNLKCFQRRIDQIEIYIRSSCNLVDSDFVIYDIQYACQGGNPDNRFRVLGHLKMSGLAEHEPRCEKTCLRGSRTTKAQTILHICAV